MRRWFYTGSMHRALIFLCGVLVSCGGTVQTNQSAPAGTDAGGADVVAEAIAASGRGGGGAGGSSGSVSDASHPADTIVLDPSTIQFFGLPINSMRAAVSGWDPVLHACATITWDYSNNGMYMGAHCDDFKAGFPYVNVTMNTDGPYGTWEYTGNVELDAAKGCVDFKQFGPASVDWVDVVAQVHGPVFTGTVVASNLALLSPKPTVFGIRYVTDVPEDVYVQSSNDLGLPTWVHVTQQGSKVELFDRCDIPKCGEPSGVCGASQHQVVDITSGTYQGQVYLMWDGRQRKLDAANHCMYAEPAGSGTYEAQFCLGWSIGQSTIGTDVLNPQCYSVTFSYPADRVVYEINNGG